MIAMVVAPHPDDDILGVGGTIARLAREGNSVIPLVVTSCYGNPFYSNEYAEENRAQYKNALKVLGVEPEFLEFPTLKLGNVPMPAISMAISNMVNVFKPSEIYVPHWGDLHYEHQIACQASLVASRPGSSVKRIYAYEVPSETGWSEPTGAKAFVPTVYVDISDTLEAKISAMEEFKQQLQPNPSPRSKKAIISLAGYRGSQVGIEHAEAFELIREVK